MKIVVFDLDETLGYFTEFNIFWESLNKFLYETQQYQLTQNDFNYVLDLYPEFLRPNIIAILNYLKYKKMSQCCNKIMIYTNNQGPKKWSNYLITYFENKINYKLFDQIISAFKINGKSIEICRTTHDKTYNDLIKCSKIPLNAQICFLDDVYFPEMSHKNVYYINIKPYVFDLQYSNIIKRFEESKIGNKLIQNKSLFQNKIIIYMNDYNYSFLLKPKEEYVVDKILSKQIIIHLQNFFNKSFKNTHTKKNIKSNRKKNKTYKKDKV
jgi:hypothetical protein